MTASNEDRNSTHGQPANNGGRSSPRNGKRRKENSRHLAIDDHADSDQRVVRYPVALGKTVKSVEVLTNAEYHHVAIVFSDESALYFAIEPRFSLRAGYEFADGSFVEWPAIQSVLGHPLHSPRQAKDALGSR